MSNHTKRRTFVQGIGGMVLVGALAGCLTTADDDDDGDDNGDDSGDDAATADDSPTDADDDDTAADVGEAVMWTDYTDSEEEDVDMFLAEFEEATGHTINREDVADLDEQLETSIPAGDGPGMWAWAHDWVGRFAVREEPEFLYDASDDIEVDLDVYSGAAREAVQFDGGTFGLPFGSETVALFYNRNLVDEPPETIDEMVGIMEEYHNPADGQYGLAYPATDPYFASGFIQVFGGDMYDEEATEVTLDSQACIDGLELLEDTLFNYIPADPGYGAQVPVFAEEVAPFAINGPWELGNFRNEVEDIGVAPLPTVDGNHPRSYSGIQMWYFSSALADDSGAIDAAVDWAEWYTTNSEVTLANAENHGLIPVHTEHAEEIDVSDEVLAFAEQVDHGVPIPTHPDMDSVWEPTTDALEQVFNGDATPQEALEDAAADIRDRL